MNLSNFLMGSVSTQVHQILASNVAFNFEAHAQIYLRNWIKQGLIYVAQLSFLTWVNGD